VKGIENIYFVPDDREGQIIRRNYELGIVNDGLVSKRAGLSLLIGLGTPIDLDLPLR
jgi:hypothetical protein